jgi:SAM-dependent methyltransferase
MTRSTPEMLAGLTFTAPPERRGRIVAVVLQRVDAARPCRVLDLGCGTGLNALALAEALPRAAVTGVDLSASSVARAEAARRGHPAAARLSFVAADYLAFTGGPFDVIVSETVLHTIPGSTDTLFDKIARDLTPHGLLVYTMPTGGPGNAALTLFRRVLRRLRSPVTDSFILAVARTLHGRAYDDTLLRERIPYMYLVPSRHDGPGLHARLQARWGFQILATEPVPRTSCAQLTHHLVVARRG